MYRFRTLAMIALAAVSASACAYQPMGPEAPTYGSAAPVETATPSAFDARDFAWSARPGDSAIEGTMAYRGAGQRYTCEGGDVVLTPETAWSRRRMVILYGSATAAAVPVSIVRARTPGAPSGDYARYVRKTTCDGSNRFLFAGLPDGAWFVITVAKPVDGQGESVAVTRRVETHGGSRSVTLY